MTHHCDDEAGSGNNWFPHSTAQHSCGERCLNGQWRWRNLAVRAEYEKFDTDIIGDVDLISLGATYTFNLAR